MVQNRARTKQPITVCQAAMASMIGLDVNFRAKHKIMLVLTIFYFPFALQYFEFIARRVSKIEASWPAQDIHGCTRE